MDYLDKVNDKKQTRQKAVEKDYRLMKTVASINEASKAVSKTIKEESDKVRKVEVVNERKVEVTHKQDFKPLVEAIKEVVTKIDGLPKNITIPKTKEVAVNNLISYKDELQDILKAIANIEVKPTVNVKQPKIEVKGQEVDLSGLEAKLGEFTTKIEKSLKGLSFETNIETEDIVKGLESVKRAVNNIEFPVPNYVLPFKDSEGRATQVQLDGSGNLPISASISGADGAITDGVDDTIKATVFDYTGSNPLAVRLTDTSGNYVGAGAGTQYADGAATATPTGTVAMGFDGTNVQALNVDASGNLQAEVTNTVTIDGSAVTQPVSAASLPLPTGAATAANQQTDALTDTELRATPVVVDLGANNDVTVTSGSITVANASIPVTDNGGSLTVDGTVAATQSGSWSLAANQSVNVAQMNGVATTMGNGVSGTGVQRVTIASDSTGVIVARGAAATDAAVSGNPVYTGARASAAEPSSVSADNDAVPFWLDRKGRQVITMQAATTAVTQVAGSATSVTLKASNTSRKGLTITNDSTADLYVKLGATASTTSYTIKLKTDDYYEVPYGYTGVVDGIWSSATGNAYVTEVS